MTNDILELPVGEFDEGRWNQAIRILTYWFKNHDDTAIVMDRCWKILDRLSIELENTKHEGKRKGPILSTMEVTNPILLLWREDFLEYHRNNFQTNRDHCDPSLAPILPSKVAKLIQRYQSQDLVGMDSATHAIILDAAGKYSSILFRRTIGGERVNEESQRLQNEKGGDAHTLHREGVLFADNYLREWIDEYRRLADNNTTSGKSASSAKIAPPRPDIVAFGTLIHAWVESGLYEAPKMAEALVESLDELEEQYPNTTKPPISRITNDTGLAESRKMLYSAVLQAWARDGNPVKAKEWIDRMIREEEYPDVLAFNRLLMAYQSAGSKANDDPSKNSASNHAERAEEVLRHMQKLYHEPSGFLSDPPNVASYNIVIDVWTKRAGHESLSSRSNRSKERALEAARRAHGWFEQMKNSGITPNTVTYNTVITAYSRAGFPRESEKLLQEMITTYQNNQDGRISHSPPISTTSNETPGVDSSDKVTSMMTTKPDVQSFTSVLAGWARVGTLEAAERSDELLRVMNLPEVNIQPNVETYGSCIHCWARVAGGKKVSRDLHEHAVKRAEALYFEMSEERKISPDVYAYTGLLNVYGRSGRSRKAHAFLEACLQEYDRTRDPRMKPTVVTFTAILNAWSKASNAPEASEKAHELLHRMKEEYGIEPNAFSYSSVLDAYGRSNHPEAATKALRLFRDMQEIGGLEPNAYTCSNVLKAMARGGRVEEAEDLLFELVHDKSVKGKLGPHAFSSVLYGWSKSKKSDAPERAEKLVIKMQELYRKNMIDGPPNSVCWNNVLACWAHSKLPGAAQRADDLLRRIQEQQELEQNESSHDLTKSKGTRYQRDPRRDSRNASTQSNLIMYNTVMNAWANNGNFEKANEWYEELLQQHQLDASRPSPDDWTYRALWKSIVKANQMEVEEKIFRLKNLVQSMAKVGLKPNKNMKADLERFTQRQKRCDYEEKSNGAVF